VSVCERMHEYEVDTVRENEPKKKRHVVWSINRVDAAASICVDRHAVFTFSCCTRQRTSSSSSSSPPTHTKRDDLRLRTWFCTSLFSLLPHLTLPACVTAILTTSAALPIAIMSRWGASADAIAANDGSPSCVRLMATCDGKSSSPLAT
jgi:hypothetical protein